MKELHGLMNRQVANFALFFTKLHHFHWFVTGREFFILHEKFESLYDEVNELYDAYAERLIMIGGIPSSSMSAYLIQSSIKETSTIDPKKMVDEVIQDLELLVKEQKELTSLAQTNQDEQTADLTIQTVAAFEKHLWMLKAFNK